MKVKKWERNRRMVEKKPEEDLDQALGFTLRPPQLSPLPMVVTASSRSGAILIGTSFNNNKNRGSLWAHQEFWAKASHGMIYMGFT